ncbi:hypothetical protein PG990_012087 [Apiospora arundinis]
MNGNYHQLLFEKAIVETKEGLSRRDVESFRATTLDDLRKKIATLQNRLHAQRRLRALNRLEPFLEAIDQYGEVVSMFYRNSDIVAFIWGPLKFLLQATSAHDEAFCELLDAYESVGEAIPLLLQYQDLFRAEQHMIQVLTQMYEDIAKFQAIILHYFMFPEWQDVFSESWKTCKSRFPVIINNIRRQRSLIETQATPSEIEETRQSIQHSRQDEEYQFDEKTLRQIRDVINWLKPTNVEIDQAALIKARADHLGTGQWLFENTLFKEWFDPRFPTIPPLLWINGIPGAGKTMLASLVVQKAQELEPTPAVLYFYCKHDNPERNNFVALGRSLLAQLLNHDNGLLHTLYLKSCRSVETILSSPETVEELLALVFKACKGAYIILDGLDECPRQERQHITKWFRELVEDLPNDKPERLRCLFVSQDDGPARKDHDGLESIKIKAEDSQNDIQEYCRVEAGKLRRAYPSIPDKKANWIAETVAKSAGGILIWINLSCQSSIAGLDKELDPHVFPKKINDAYRRIMARIKEDQEAVPEEVLRLLGWLVCAKRPLKWYEIQGMETINLEKRRVDYERQKFFKSPKDLLASLVETRADGSLEFVHLTAKLFLLEERYVVPSTEELKLANLCIDYLNLPAFIQLPTVEGVLDGNYGFMDYAVLSWLPHLETGASLKTSKDDELIGQLAESLGVFIGHHWNSPTSVLPLAKRHNDRLQHFKAQPFYDRLEKVVASTRRQLKHFGNMNDREIALKLASRVYAIREVIEKVISEELKPNSQKILEEKYGTNIFKCPRFSCQFFTIGFSSAEERKLHISKHERPFRCSDERCVGYELGFPSEAQREKHMRDKHHKVPVVDEEFPSEQDVMSSLMRDQTAVGSSQVPEDPHDQDDSLGNATTPAAEQPEPESESEAESRYQPRLKRPRQTEFKCDDCNMVFQKRYNLVSHRAKHSSRRDHVCSVCQKDFVRSGELKRHLLTHTGDKHFVCRGTLRSGELWGCGKSFARADTLRKHHESRVGRSCIQPLQQESGEQIE